MQLSKFLSILALAISVTAMPLNAGRSKAVTANHGCHLDKAGRCQCHRPGSKSSRRLTARGEYWTDDDEKDKESDDSDLSENDDRYEAPQPEKWSYNCKNCETDNSPLCRDGYVQVSVPDRPQSLVYME
ncbi:hypothetical protein PspLS_00280 [Pyricularia sp. CBS 133598]|nr:hypothetical protein PspLS_00280 [Pyricularia sp. CBS 133598]